MSINDFDTLFDDPIELTSDGPKVVRFGRGGRLAKRAAQALDALADIACDKTAPAELRIKAALELREASRAKGGAQ